MQQQQLAQQQQQPIHVHNEQRIPKQTDQQSNFQHQHEPQNQRLELQPQLQHQHLQRQPQLHEQLQVNATEFWQIKLFFQGM
jgi:hypothetical protein